MTQIKNSRFTRAIAFAAAFCMFVGTFPARAGEYYVILKDGRRVEGSAIRETSLGDINLVTEQGIMSFAKGTYRSSSLSKPDFVSQPEERSAASRPTTSASKAESVSRKAETAKRLCWFDPSAEADWEKIIQSSERLSLAPRMNGVDAAQAEKQLEEFGTCAMPNAYAQYREARAKVQEVQRTLLENFPQGPASDPTDGSMFAKANKNLAATVARVFRQRDELCFFLLFHQMGLFSDEMLAKFDSRPILLRLAAESAEWPDDTPAADATLAAEDAAFATQHLPETHAGYQRLCELFNAGAKQYANLRRTALILDATRARGELAMLKERLDSIQDILQQYKKEFAVKRLELGMGDATTDSLAALDQANVATIQKFEKEMGVKAYVAQRATRLVVTLPGGATMEMVWCPPGTFTMGSSQGNAYEQPHQVTLSKGFWMGKTEVTQEQWMSVMENNPSRYTGNDLPVEQVSWKDCQKFCKKTGLQLPTEAQWEYACRAGSTGEYAGTGKLDDMGWYSDNSGHQTHPVGSKQPNAWGLYDMHGNVCEWCADWFGSYPSEAVTDPQGPSSGNNRVKRGGSWYDSAGSFGIASSCTSSSRGEGSLFDLNSYNGFRLVRTLSE